MAWQVEMVRILRHLIDDLDSSDYDYSDLRLQELLLAAGQLALDDVVFANTYTIDVETLTLSPDPTSDEKDNGFINLTCLKARCLLYEGVFRHKARLAGLSIKSGSESISSGGSLAGYKILMETACKDYKDAKWEYEAGNRIPGRAIIGPFAGDAVSWLDENPGSRYNHGIN